MVKSAEFFCINRGANCWRSPQNKKDENYADPTQKHQQALLSFSIVVYWVSIVFVDRQNFASL
ncbi:MAG: hypothetical protein N2235_08640 [Fischerella sp.]|nr:hypothetical protein [Fischerella sp.]